MTEGALYAAQPAEVRGSLRAALASGQVSAALLLRLDFASGAVRLCNWNVPVIDGREGSEWVPIRVPVGFRDVEGGAGNLAPLRIYQMTVPRELMRAFAGTDAGNPFPDLSDKSVYQNRTAELMLQIMGPPDPETGRATPLGYPMFLHAGKMDRIVGKVSRAEIVHELHVEGTLARKAVPGNGFLTPRDHRARFPDDLGLDYVTEIPVRPARWPNF
jgi:hypothetical protein